MVTLDLANNSLERFTSPLKIQNWLNVKVIKLQRYPEKCHCSCKDTNKPPIADDCQLHETRVVVRHSLFNVVADMAVEIY